MSRFSLRPTQDELETAKIAPATPRDIAHLFLELKNVQEFIKKAHGDQLRGCVDERRILLAELIRCPLPMIKAAKGIELPKRGSFDRPLPDEKPVPKTWEEVGVGRDIYGNIVLEALLNLKLPVITESRAYLTSVFGGGKEEVDRFLDSLEKGSEAWRVINDLHSRMIEIGRGLKTNLTEHSRRELKNELKELKRTLRSHDVETLHAAKRLDDTEKACVAAHNEYCELVEKGRRYGLTPEEDARKNALWAVANTKRREALALQDGEALVTKREKANRVERAIDRLEPITWRYAQGPQMLELLKKMRSILSEDWDYRVAISSLKTRIIVLERAKEEGRLTANQKMDLLDAYSSTGKYDDYESIEATLDEQLAEIERQLGPLLTRPLPLPKLKWW